MSEKIVHVSDEAFESDVLNADQPVLVDYWAEWCGPCKMIAPVLEEIAEQAPPRGLVTLALLRSARGDHDEAVRLASVALEDGAEGRRDGDAALCVELVFER